ncbi:phosphate ABC transporter substrate-binding protein PstS [Psychrobacter lutiphocae]|uniref:phosphate ABC transporter substrate-binding protein PstS n=1 Tax=Psychrobacter lutiphocae TaxID=540500 RepID=UPI000366CE50|nr:phosphate ABC transporter substrate-binding protein PstS [Psychrobacter lutiphocae]
MRYSLLAVAVATMLGLTACGNNKEATDPAEGTTENAAATTGESTTNADQYIDIDGIEMNISGAGASFPAPIYQKWSADYQAATKGQVNYNSIGSSGGVKQIQANTVDFGASDMPLQPAELESAGLIQFPTVIGGVVPVVNIEGVEPGKLVLSGEVLADIYLGKITKWNDPAITALNEGLALPDAGITTVHRSDGSGTTFNFTYYLNEVSSDWSAVGVDKSVEWPTDATGTGVGGKGNEGVAGMVKQAPNSIGYVEYAYAKQNSMSHASMINAAGNTVEPSADTFAASGNVDWSQAEGFYKVIANSDTADAWPIAAATFILVHKNPKNPEKVAGVLNFFNWAYDQGDQAALDLDYVPFPDEAVALFKEEWKQVVGSDGQPVYTPK